MIVHVQIKIYQAFHFTKCLPVSLDPTSHMEKSAVFLINWSKLEKSSSIMKLGAHLWLWLESCESNLIYIDTSLLLLAEVGPGCDLSKFFFVLFSSVNPRQL